MWESVLSIAIIQYTRELVNSTVKYSAKGRFWKLWVGIGWLAATREGGRGSLQDLGKAHHWIHHNPLLLISLGCQPLSLCCLSVVAIPFLIEIEQSHLSQPFLLLPTDITVSSLLPNGKKIVTREPVSNISIMIISCGRFWFNSSNIFRMWRRYVDSFGVCME